MSYLRLRQICLVAHDLDAPTAQLCEAFGLAVAHRDPLMAQLRMRNILIPVGRDPVFIEIVQPVEPGTTAERYLERRGGDGGYMYISDTSDLEGVRRRATDAGVRFITDRNHRDAIPVETFQLHPRDTGGAMLEFDRHGAGEDMHGAYRWAGPDWRKALRTEPVVALTGAEMQSDDPPSLAARWAAIFGLPVVESADGHPELRLDNAFARFVPTRDDRGEGLSAVHLAARDPDAVRDRARGAGAAFDGPDPVICGVRFILSAQGD